MPPEVRTEPAYPGRHRGGVLILGSAWCLREDLARARALRPEADILAVNDAARLSPARHVFSLQAELVLGYAAEARRHTARPVDVHYGWPSTNAALAALPAGSNPLGRGYRWSGYPEGLSSGLAAAHVALFGLGYDEAVLCGVPLDAGGYDAEIDRHSPVADPAFRRVHARFRARAAATSAPLKGRVYSLSGFTRDLFGEPGS